MTNYSNLSNDQLYIQYQEARQQLSNAEIGTPEEIKLDILFTELSKEVADRDMDLKSYKLKSKEQNIQYNNKTNSMKTIRNIISTIILTGTIILNTLTPVRADSQQKTTHEPNGMYNTIVTKVTDTEVYVNINDNIYSFECEEEGWEIGDKLTVILNNDEITNIRPTIDFKTVYKLSDNGTTYTNQLYSDKDLENYAKQWLKDNFNDTLDISIVFNKIYNSADSNTRIYGLTTFKDNKPTQIIIDSDLSQEFNQIRAERTLVHELLHYILSKQSKHYEDRQDDFENAIMKYGSCSNDGTIYYMNSHVKVNQDLYNVK
jgi:hypothetical protein